jgi:hypothetical protein
MQEKQKGIIEQQATSNKPAAVAVAGSQLLAASLACSALPVV